MKRVGIDVGGTFTDVVLIDDTTGQVWPTKVPTTPQDRVIGAMDGFRRILELSGCAAGEIGFLGHGTTMATNMVVEGKGAPVALITTTGFRDILELRRVARHDRADLYDLMFHNPRPLVPRRWRLEVDGRLHFDGAEETPLDIAGLEALAARIAGSDIEAVAVSFLHAYANPAHEQQALALLRARLPEHFICGSHEVNPEMAEYERTSSTVINAMLGPVCGRYINRLEAALQGLGFAGDFLFMQSNGGLAAPAMIVSRPLVLLESGPAGGVSAAIRSCEQGEIRNAILGDMGGTTFDVSLIRDYRPELRTGTLLHSYAVRSPSIDIDSVGAGGGSIVWIDAGGGVRIGPHSAGADPGPACYGRGGTEATVTDCNVVLGYIDPDSFLGGEFRLDAAAARRAVEEHVARPLGIGVEAAAATVRRVANALMAQAIRIMTVERGFDPREFAYICYGGAGPVHALDLAAEIGIRQVIIPPLPGLFSAFGMTVADQQYDFQAPVNSTLDLLTGDALAMRFATLEAEGAARIAAAGPDPAGITIIRRAECRYVGQPDVIPIELEAGELEAGGGTEALRRAFEAAHRRLWNFTSPDKPIELANIRVQIVTSSGWRGSGATAPQADAAVTSHTRRVYLNGTARDVAVYPRAGITIGSRIEGPAVIEEASTCVVLDVRQSAVLDAQLNLVIELAA